MLITINDESRQCVFSVEDLEESRTVRLSLNHGLPLCQLHFWISRRLLTGLRPTSRDHELLLQLLHAAMLHPSGVVYFSKDTALGLSWLKLVEELSRGA